jgi:arylsulfatase
LNIARSDEIGTPVATNGNYPLGWAQAANTPFRYWKSDANSEGGTHNPLIVSWPNGIKEKGGIRNQYSHVIDLLPTTLDLVGLKAPEEIRGVKQQPVEGFSFADSINNAGAPWHHTLQYYYIFGSRSIYDDGWKAELAYPNDVLMKGTESDPPFDENAWELYNLKDDPTERIDLAKKYPEKLAQLKTEYEQQAQSHHLYPYITFDDLREKRVHHTYLPDFLKQRATNGR